jgi:flagellar motility protein MotE (MotC chaperone)
MLKNIIIWTVIFSSTFGGFVATFYFGKDKFTPTLSKIQKPDRPEAVPVTDSTSTAAIDSLKLVIDELLKQLSEYIVKTQELEQTVSSQKIEIGDLSAKNDSLRKDIENIKKHSTRIEDLTKTLGAMKPEVLKPILAKLPDEIVQILYVRAKTKDKQKIFSAMPPERAGKLLKEMAKTLL